MYIAGFTLSLLLAVSSATESKTAPDPALVIEPKSTAIQISLSSSLQTSPASSDLKTQQTKHSCDEKAIGDAGCGTNLVTVRPEKCGPKNKKTKCKSGECCSANGKCGLSEAFCGKHCQSDYGHCWTRSDLKPNVKAQRCGKDFNNTKCAAEYCCSAAGWCGKGVDYCFVPFNCQTGFGFCDSDAAPQGPDLSPLVQPREQMGDVPYGEAIKKCIKPRTAALTFDDGPSNNTAQILDVLRQYGAKATFFLTGNNDGKGMIDRNGVWIEIVKRIVYEGHQIGSHTWSHSDFSTMSRDGRLYEMIRNDRAIANIVGKFPTYMRAPFLKCSLRNGCLKDMADIGYHVIEFDVDSHDWESTRSLEQMKAIIDQTMVHRGAQENMLLIQHDHNKHAVELTRYVLEQLLKKEWQAVTLGECLEDPPEFWYQEPMWIEPKSVAGDSVNRTRGCVVSEPGFCGKFFPFTDKAQCKSAVKECIKSKDDCEATRGRGQLVCAKYAHVCAEQKSFCETCGEKGQQLCNSDGWMFKRLGY